MVLTSVLKFIFWRDYLEDKQYLDKPHFYENTPVGQFQTNKRILHLFNILKQWNVVNFLNF